MTARTAAIARRLVRGVLSLAAVLHLTACGVDSDDLYATYSAYFRYTAVSTTPPLLSALTSPGMFCAISFSNSVYNFRGCDGATYTYTPTAVDAQITREYINGFIVGTPAVQDLTGSSLVAYDLVCPNCYVDSYIQRSLTFATTSTVQCGRCQRTYDLNNSGIVISDEGGTSLFRYHITYAATGTGVLIIQN